MNRSLAIALVALAPCLAHAQPATPPPPPNEARAGPGPARGAEIRIERPDLSLHVRCGEGEGSKFCAETAMQLIEKLAAMPVAERRDRRGERDGPRGERDGPRWEDRRPRDRDY